MPTPLKAPIGWNESTHKKVCLYSIVAGQPFATVAQQCIDPNTNKSTFDSSSVLQYGQQRVSNLCKFIVQCIILLNVRQTRRRLTYICCCIVKACRNFKSGKPRSRHNPLPRGFDLNNIGFTTNLPPITTEQYRNQFPSNTMARTKSKSTQASGSKSTKAAGMKTRFRFPPTGIHSPSSVDSPSSSAGSTSASGTSASGTEYSEQYTYSGSGDTYDASNPSGTLFKAGAVNPNAEVDGKPCLHIMLKHGSTVESDILDVLSFYGENTEIDSTTKTAIKTMYLIGKRKGARRWLDSVVNRKSLPRLSRNKHGVIIPLSRSEKSNIPMLEAAQKTLENHRDKNSTRALTFKIQKNLMERKKDETILVFIEFGNNCDGTPIIGTNLSPIDDDDNRVIQPYPIQTTVSTHNTQAEEELSQERMFGFTLCVGMRSSQFGKKEKKDSLDLRGVMEEVEMLDEGTANGNSSSKHNGDDDDDDDDDDEMSESSEDESSKFFAFS